MPAEEFSKYVQKYVNTHTQHKVSGIGIINPNPNAGKHLVTATLRINNIPIDICCLRSDNYSTTQNHTIGTPLEDARRRDFTVNALFFRINDYVVEDVTDKGLSDLENKIIRTPIEARETLVDDPLRSLRAIRFSAKMGFVIDEELEREIRSQYITERIQNGISRERIGKEVVGMIDTGRPAYCMDRLNAYNLLQAICGDSPCIQKGVDTIKSFEFYAKKYGCWDVENRRSVSVLAGLTLGFIPSFSESTDKTVLINAVQSIVIERLKLSMKEKNNVFTILCGLQYMIQFRDKLEWSRLEMGRFVLIAGEWWLETLCLFASVHSPIESNILSPNDKCTANVIMVPWIDSAVNAVRAEALDHVYKMKPLVNGDEVSQLFKRKKGAWLKDVLNKIIELQIEYPLIERSDIIERLLHHGAYE